MGKKNKERTTTVKKEFDRQAKANRTKTQKHLEKKRRQELKERDKELAERRKSRDVPHPGRRNGAVLDLVEDLIGSAAMSVKHSPGKLPLLTVESCKRGGELRRYLYADEVFCQSGGDVRIQMHRHDIADDVKAFLPVCDAAWHRRQMHAMEWLLPRIHDLIERFKVRHEVAEEQFAKGSTVNVVASQEESKPDTSAAMIPAPFVPLSDTEEGRNADTHAGLG